MKKLVACVMSVGILLCNGVAFAATSTKPAIEKVEYEGNGRVDVDFIGKVAYDDVKVSVNDSSGKIYSASVLEMDDDELDFVVSGIQPGTKYGFIISGVGAYNGDYSNVAGSFETRSSTSSAIEIEKIKYSGGKVEVDFYSDNVRYKNAKVTVYDTAGKEYSAKIVERDSDEIDFTVSGLAAGTYTFKISGIYTKGMSTTVTAEGKFSVPTTAAPGSIVVKDVEYDDEDGELNIDFSTRVQWKSPKVTVKDSSGKTYSCRITDRDSDDVDIRVTGIDKVGTYTYSISGIRARGASTYTTITGKFEVYSVGGYDDDYDDDDDYHDYDD